MNAPDDIRARTEAREAALRAAISDQQLAIPAARRNMMEHEGALLQLAQAAFERGESAKDESEWLAIVNAHMGPCANQHDREQRVLLAQRCVSHQRLAAGERRTYQHEDFIYDVSSQRFIERITLVSYPADAVNDLILREHWRAEVRHDAQGRQRERLIPPSDDIRRIESGQVVESTTWWPGMPKIIMGKIASEDGLLVDAAGTRMFNRYRPAPIYDADPEEARPWAELVRELIGDEALSEFFFDYFAHMVQRPGEKCNAGIVLSGAQGIGKDTILEPLKFAAGVWNTQMIDPDAVFEPFQPWVQALLIVINEVRPTDEHTSMTFYQKLKVLLATPPELLPLKQKYLPTRFIANVARVVMTTNDPQWMHLPPDERRVAMIHSPRPQGWKDAAFFAGFYRWLAEGGWKAVAAWLRRRDLNGFDPKAAPPSSAMKREVQATSSLIADQTMVDALAAAGELMGEEQPAVFLKFMLDGPRFDPDNKLAELKRAMDAEFRFPKRLRDKALACGYVLVQPQGVKAWTFAQGRYRSQPTLALLRADLAETLDDSQRAEAVRRAGMAAVKKVAMRLHPDAPEPRS